MALRVALAVAFIAVVIVVAMVIERRRRARVAPAPARDRHAVPRQLRRADFPRPEAEILVVLFSSTTCASCEPMRPKVAVLESAAVAVADVVFPEDRARHEAYGIDAVPLVLVADAAGVVRRAFLGATTATDLWAAVAGVRDPSRDPEPGLGALG